MPAGHIQKYRFPRGTKRSDCNKQHMDLKNCNRGTAFCLMLSTLGNIYSADNILKYLSYFSEKTGFDISCKLSPLETICMKCQNPIFFFLFSFFFSLFFWKSWKKIMNLFCLFVCVEVLRPSQPNGVMSNVVSLPNHTFTGQA